MDTIQATALSTVTLNHIYGLYVCKQWQHCIWPEQVTSHFRGKEHRESLQTARGIAKALSEQWGRLAMTAQSFLMPSGVQEVVEDLPLHQDGLQCRLEPETCSFISRNEKHMRAHCNHVHNWSGGKGGRKRSQALLS